MEHEHEQEVNNEEETMNEEEENDCTEDIFEEEEEETEPEDLFINNEGVISTPESDICSPSDEEMNEEEEFEDISRNQNSQIICNFSSGESQEEGSCERIDGQQNCSDNQQLGISSNEEEGAENTIFAENQEMRHNAHTEGTTLQDPRTTGGTPAGDDENSETLNDESQESFNVNKT